MAWRIDDSVIRGEIDNREKGVVRGRLWLEGMAEPVILELAGNACPDIAGCLLKFVNPLPAVPMRKDRAFAKVQSGCIGDLTASRKVRVFGVSPDEAMDMVERGEEPPECLSSSLYLEWFSASNGRVVIESADFEIELSPPEWRMSPEDEEQRQAEASAGWSDFLGQLDAAVERQKRGSKDPDEEWDEFDYERFMKEGDARTDKYGELLDKYGDSDEAHERIAEEMGWNREASEEDAEEERRQIEEMNAACEAALSEPEPEPEPHLEGIDWIRTEEGDIRHPVQHRCYEAGVRFWRQCDELGLDEADDDDLDQFIAEFQTTGAKLAGALAGIARGHGPHDPAFTVAALKRALDHLHKSLAGLEASAMKRDPEKSGQRLLPESLVTEARRELFEIREQILRLMQEFRNRK